MLKTLMLIILLSLSLQAQLANWKGRVHLTIQGKDEVGSVISSYLNRELRKLGDVLVVDTTPDFEISIVFIEQKLTTSDRRLGWAMSTVVLEERGIPEAMLANVIVPTYQELIKTHYTHLFTMAEHYLWVGAMSDLETNCVQLIATIDSDVFEPRRKLWRELKDSAPKKP